MNSIKGDRAVDLVVSLNDLKKLQKNDSLETFELVPFSKAKPLTKYLQKNKKRTFNDLPFYEGLLFNKKIGKHSAAVYMDKEIVNTAARKDFILDNLCG
jgi:hypothetical protein